MAYKTEDLIEQSLEAIKKHNLIFVNDIFAYTPFVRKTFYDHDLHKSDTIKSELAKNRINMKIEMRAKWYASDNATLQIGLMKLIADDDEAHRLNGTKREVKHDTTDKEINIKIHR
jgi:hypothetical protein